MKLTQKKNQCPYIFDPNTECDSNNEKVTSISDTSYANISVNIFDILLSETNEQQRNKQKRTNSQSNCKTRKHRQIEIKTSIILNDVKKKS